MEETDIKAEEAQWYALKVFYNRVFKVKDAIEKEGFETYVPMHVVEKFDAGQLSYVEKQLIPSLLFVRCPLQWLLAFKRQRNEEFMYYCDIATKRPAAIRDEEMRIFIMVTSADKGRGINYMGEDAPEFHTGDKVRVIDGIYKGAEGCIKRIKKDRKLLVSVSGVAVIAISYISPSNLQKI